MGPESPRDPQLPGDLDLRELPRSVRAELRGLSAEHAEVVAGHLLMAARFIDDDPVLAYAHAQAARRRAARLPVTREAAGETAYAVGEYADALNEFRTLRRMTGRDDYLPAMADCERALGRHQSALRLVKEGLAAGTSDVAHLIELRLVEAGVRVELGQREEALRLLRAEIERIGPRGPKPARARLRYAFADLLERDGDDELAERWFASAAALDVAGATDAADRVERLQGMTIEFDTGDEPSAQEEPAGEGELLETVGKAEEEQP